MMSTRGGLPPLDRNDWNWMTLLTCHNSSRFIESALHAASRAVQELIDHTSSSHCIGLLVVDDDASENEAAKLLEVTSRLVFPDSCRVTVVRLGVNSGVSAARYEGLRRTGRSFVHIMDQDDEVKPGSYAAVLAHYVNAEDPLWITGCEHIDAKYVVTGTDGWSPSEASTRRLNDVDCWLSVGKQVHGSPGMVVLSPALRDGAEQYFKLLDRRVDGSDDYWMFIYLLKKGAYFVVADELGFRYRQHESNQSIGHDFLTSAQQGLVIMHERGLLSERECSIVAARYRLLARLQRYSRSRPIRLLAYLLSPLATYRLMRARLTS